MNALHVERAQAFFNQLRELRGQRRFLDVIVSLKQIDAIRLLVFDLCANRGGGQDGRQNASRIALTMVRANSVLMRSSAVVSC